MSKENNKPMTCGMRTAWIPGYFTSVFGKDAEEFRKMAEKEVPGFFDVVRLAYKPNGHIVDDALLKFIQGGVVTMDEKTREALATPLFVGFHDPNTPRPGYGVEDKWRPFTHLNCVAMLMYQQGERGGVSPSCWHVSRECGKELIDSMRESDLQLYTDAGLPTGARPTDDDFENGSIKIIGVPILPAYITEPKTEGGLTSGNFFQVIPRYVFSVDTAGGPGQYKLAAYERVIARVNAHQIVVSAEEKNEIPVTEEMLEAQRLSALNDPTDAAKAYRAMRALEPTDNRDTPTSRHALRVALEERGILIDALRFDLAAKYARIAELKSELAALRQQPPAPVIAAQQTLGDTTYTVFANDPSTIVADSKHAAADVKPPPKPKVFPAQALKQNTRDQRRIGGS